MGRAVKVKKCHFFRAYIVVHLPPILFTYLTFVVYAYGYIIIALFCTGLLVLREKCQELLHSISERHFDSCCAELELSIRQRFSLYQPSTLVILSRPANAQLS